MENWDEIRTAFQVARLGTVSGAAEVLGVHHATVIRHIDSLESRLGVKLFQRHARGYTPTEAGADLLHVAQATDDQFNQLSGRLRNGGDGMSGDLVVTSLAFFSPVLVPALKTFQDLHPDLTIRYLTGERLFRLEYGEAHVAIRAGRAPDQPDNVVQHFVDLKVALFASEDYVDAHGLPETNADFSQHRFVGHDNPDSRAPQDKWMRENVPASSVSFRSGDYQAINDAVFAGAGIGFVYINEAARRGGLVEVLPPRPEWSPPLWLVTHVDLHRSKKVQTFLQFLKEQVKTWDL